MASATKENLTGVEEEDSDVEIDGVDMEGDDMEEDDAEDDKRSNVSETEAAGIKPALLASAEETDALATEDAKEMEEARKEQMELMAAERKKEEAAGSQVTDIGDQFGYLIAQSEVFAHFLAGSVATSSGKAKKGSRGKKGRMSEAEEDAQLMKSAQSRRRGVVRVDKQPSMLASHCKMHAYQLEGLNWLIKLHSHGINGILADEMGLGKTLQTISLLCWLYESRGVTGPHLVIVPKSVVGNWLRELKKWAPIIKAIRLGGTKDERQRFLAEHATPDAITGKFHWDVLVTSYEGFLKLKGKLSKIDWKYLIIDEAHRIKNENSSLSRAVRTVNTESRLLITGTPLQNNLRELWALLNFLLPSIFGNAEQFDQWFSLSDPSGKENVVKKLHTVLRPFMLRRVKKDVATSLPPKKETKLYIGLTQMQHEWYVKVLQKDAHELNKLGGPDRLRLLNVMMQLRKVCNHPYLFDGAESKPYKDGPHLWENSGKMMLFHKLLIKLKEKGSRVLVFCQMTRVLDILEDYMRFVGYEYCRIDGNTSGESRDSQMDDFNEEGSSKFAFLLSTRAGGLGINLATADIVILYDSDWNPQVDLQAMDRAHRIGQKKPVQVFRFITEGTIEEKIIERADRKLFLDAAVIQQGQLAAADQSVDRDSLMRAVRFGADQILSRKGGTYTDDDIDALIAKGEERTSAQAAKLQTNAKHDLANFSLLGDDGGMDTFSFDGKNYRESDKNVGNFINLPQRQRKRNYDVNEYFRDAMNQGGPSSGMKAHAADAASKKRKKGPSLHDFQLFDRDRLAEIAALERRIAGEKEQHLRIISEMRANAKQSATSESQQELLRTAEDMEKKLDDFKLPKEIEEERSLLVAEGFPDWTKKDYRSFTSSLEKHGRYDFKNVSKDVMDETGKELKEVQRYFVAFWTNYRRIQDWKKVIERVERGEKKILRLRQIRDSIQEKVERHIEDTFGEQFEGALVGEIPSSADLLNHSWSKMKISYPTGTRSRAYQEEEDAFLIYMMHRHGYGAAERIRLSIRRAWQFRFDWYFKSRSAPEIQKRCDALVKLVEKENEELRKQEEPKDSPIPKQSELVSAIDTERIQD